MPLLCTNGQIICWLSEPWRRMIFSNYGYSGKKREGACWKTWPFLIWFGILIVDAVQIFFGNSQNGWPFSCFLRSNKELNFHWRSDILYGLLIATLFERNWGGGIKFGHWTISTKKMFMKSFYGVSIVKFLIFMRVSEATTKLSIQQNAKVFLSFWADLVRSIGRRQSINRGWH